MQIQQKRLAVLDQPVGVLQVGLALADGLHLGPAQRHAGLELLEQKVVVAGRRGYAPHRVRRWPQGRAASAAFSRRRVSFGTITWLVWRGTVAISSNSSS